MFRYSISWYIFAFTLLESIIKTHLTVHDSSHSFISNNQRYFDDDLSAIHEEIASGLRSTRINDATLKLQLKFEPAFLDFKYRPLGVPHLEKVTLFNVDANKSIDMTSISGSTVHFHSSFFEDKKIPPLGNTSFNVVFLGREEGFVESSLFIHTTEGHFKYNVKGASIFSPYRLRPIVGIKLPVNASFSPLIYMHNPHTEPIQITEIYSSGGEFHLELPTGELEGPKDMWEIPPLQTKAIIRVRFQAKSEQNHTAYVRIKVNSSEEILVVPLEVEVSSNGGIFEPQGSIDFGVGGSLDHPKHVDICVFNPLKKSVKIQSITATSEAIKVEYEHVRLPPNKDKSKETANCVVIGTLTLNWSTAFKTKDYSGKIIVKYKNGKSVTEIPYYLTVLEGGLSYDPLLTRYFINDKSEDLSSRVFKIRNNFLSSVTLINISLHEDAQIFFKIENFKSMVLKPQEEGNIFTIKLKSGVKLSDLKVNSNIFLKTNVSDLIIPILSYNGKLLVQLPFESRDYSLDLGLVSAGSKKDVHFLVGNTNPVSITLKNIQSSIPMTSAERVGCGKDQPYDLALLQVSFRNLTKCNVLKTGHYAIIRLTVKTLDSSGHQVWGDVQVETKYENLSVPVHFKVAPGKLEIGPDRLVFDQCFPGKICSHPLRVHSTFHDPMIIESITTLPPDHRVFSKHTGHILARATKVIGHLYLDPALGCGNECYTGLQHDTTAQWLKTLSLSKSVSDFDLNLVNVFYNRYLNLTSNGLKRWQNLTLRLDTSEVRGHIFKSRVKMSWPSLLGDQNIDNKSVFTFPLTQIGNVTYRNVTVRNPSSYNLIVQLVFDRDYPDVKLMYEGLPNTFIPNNLQKFKNLTHVFFFADNYKQHYYNFIDMLNYNANENSIPLLLQPNENFTFMVGFRGVDTVSNSALIFIRNNLTILEVIRLKGQAAHPLFRFGNRKPGSSEELMFELTEKHLKDCQREKQTPPLMVKRSFTARNTGDVTIYVHSFFINDQLCEGYGFKVLNCEPFVLHPNKTRKIDIAFTPDLTLTKVTRMLFLGTSLNFPVNYTLHAKIPPYYLNLCSNLIMRPGWEVNLSYIAISLMFLLLFIIIILAVMDAERVKKQALAVLLQTSSISAQPILDLRLVGQQTRAEIHSNKIDYDEQHQQQQQQQQQQDKICERKDVGVVTKTEQIVDDFQAKPKQEIEKYTVLVPVTGRSKRKLAKKNSGEPDLNETQRKIHEVQRSSKIKTVEAKSDDRKLHNVKETMKRVVHNKNKAKNTVVPAYEEETSSTTTESSSNNDDTEKDVVVNDQRNSKSCSRKSSNNNVNNNNNNNSNNKPEHQVPINNNNNNNNTSSEEASNELKSTHQKIERRRSGPKLNQQQQKLNAVDPMIKQNDMKQMKTRININNNNNNNNKKEKQHANKKLALADKKVHHHRNVDMNRVSPNTTARVSPPISSPVWGETRATFSDIVARTETNVTRTTTSLPTKPTMYVEPYKQPSLGPIGSERSEFWQDNQEFDQNSSFFSNSQDLGLDNSSPFLDDFVSSDNWSAQNNGLMGLLESNDNTDTWNQNLLNPCWNSMNYNSLIDALPTVQQPIQQQQQQQPGYLWGSSSVWEPWAPPQTPTRTPPGFDIFHQRKFEEEKKQQREVYNPFGTNSLWTQQQQQQQQQQQHHHQQQQPNPWNYHQGQ